MSAGTRAVAPFVLNLVGGVLILVGAIVTSIFAFGSSTFVGSMSGMMGGMSGGMGGMMIGLMMGVYPIFSIIGLTSGALVIIGAVMLYGHPFEKDHWGAIVIAFSILNRGIGFGSRGWSSCSDVEPNAKDRHVGIGNSFELAAD